jgi:Spy/CpxP family protein refolding chaperone
LNRTEIYSSKETLMMRSLRYCVLALAAIGCGGGGANRPNGGGGDVAESTPHDPTTGVGTEIDESTGDLAEHHRHHHHGGIAMFIAISLESLDATPEQQAKIKQIRTDLHAKMAPARAAEKVLQQAIADGVRAGKVDHDALEPAIAELKKQSEGIHDAIADTLNSLHATLTKEQRAALVEKVEAHFEVWHHSNAPNADAKRDAQGGHLAKLSKDLSLTPDQVEKIRASFAEHMQKAPQFDRAKADEHLKAFGAAFESDTFDAKTLTAGAQVHGMMAMYGSHRQIRFYAAVAPVLTPEQRTKLADELTKHGNYKHGEEAH